MENKTAEDHVRELYEHMLQRPPSDAEVRMWADQLVATEDPIALFRQVVGSKEYKGRKDRTGVKLAFPVGHYYSAIVDPASIEPFYQRSLASTVSDLRGIELDVESMVSFWNDNLSVIRSTPFSFEGSAGQRFRFSGAPFPWGDAVTLRAMMATRRPRQIIEIGSGFSTACMLDTADEFGLDELRLTCIEPHPDSLRSLLWPQDHARVRIIESPVQKVGIEVFRALQAGDFLFIDSTHVLKTGSDVHYELFDILPALAPGVIIHFHDCPFPFEYNARWVLEFNASWNEAYALRAYLTDNRCYRISFWYTLLDRLYPDMLAAPFPPPANRTIREAGSSIWIEKLGDAADLRS